MAPLIVVFLWMGSLRAQEILCPMPDSLAGVGAVMGTVVDAENELPLGFVDLRLQVVGVRGVLEARSDTSGRFQYCSVPAGTFTIAGQFGQMSGFFGPGELEPGERFFLRMEVGEFAVTYETGTLTGSVVRAGADEPIEGATVLLSDRGLAAVTNPFGRFTFPSLPPGTVHIQARLIGLGDVEGRVEVQAGKTTEARFRLGRESIGGEPFAVVDVRRRMALPGMDGLERRYHSGRGLFILEEQIQARNPTELTVILKDPGVGVEAAGEGGIIMTRTGCAPEVYLDGTKLTNREQVEGAHGGEQAREPDQAPEQGQEYGAEEEAEAAVNLVHPLSVLALEVYRDPDETPGQFLSSSARCGVILVWTRRGNISGG